MILAIGEALMELRRSTPDGRVAAPGEWAGPFPSGAPAIFASVAARLGTPVALAAAVGDDRFGHALRERLAGDGVDVAAVRVVPGRATALAFVAYAEGGGRDFWFSVHDSAAIEVEPPALDGVDWLHVSGSTLGFGARLAELVAGAAERLAERGIPVSLDPNLRPDADPGVRERLNRVARVARVLFPSDGELAGLDVAPGALVCQTHGADGATVAGVHVPAPRVAEVDPTGAGDTFAAAFLSAFRAHPDPVAAAERACRVAAHSVGVLGAMEAPVGAPARD
jgi:sugar/nucleoside kinase (ribokinase family)